MAESVHQVSANEVRLRGALATQPAHLAGALRVGVEPQCEVRQLRGGHDYATHECGEHLAELAKGLVGRVLPGPQCLEQGHDVLVDGGVLALDLGRPHGVEAVVFAGEDVH